MALKLTIDRGNTATKLAVWHDDEIVAESSSLDFKEADIEDLASRIGGRFDVAILSSVRETPVSIIENIKHHSDRFVELDSNTPLPIKLCYDSPATLGHDRIAAAVGAFDISRGQWALVVDVGTAITYDVLSPDGEFAGGNIAPGVHMRLDALNHFTARLPLVDPQGECPQWGHDTTTALRAGALYGVVAEIDYYRRKLNSGDAMVILTGGSAPQIASMVSFQTIVDQNLVMKGLNSIINYNHLI